MNTERKKTEIREAADMVQVEAEQEREEVGLVQAREEAEPVQEEAEPVQEEVARLGAVRDVVLVQGETAKRGAVRDVVLVQEKVETVRAEVGEMKAAREPVEPEEVIEMVKAGDWKE
ncbi:MAG: hypothetical protein RSL74_08455, partial [Clostridium sp.]